MKAIHYNDTTIQARNYAAADVSDPFTYGRVMAHIRSGICDDTGGMRDCRYKADPATETRYLPSTEASPQGEAYQVTVYRNMQRP